MIGELFIIFIGVVLVNNFVLVRFLGLCPYIGVYKKDGLGDRNGDGSYLCDDYGFYDHMAYLHILS